MTERQAELLLSELSSISASLLTLTSNSHTLDRVCEKILEREEAKEARITKADTEEIPF